MKKYNLLFENVNPHLKTDIERCLSNRIGFCADPNTAITYYISIKDSKISVVKYGEYYNEIINYEYLWNEFIPFIPKKENTIIVSNLENVDMSCSLANKLGYKNYCYGNIPIKQGMAYILIEHVPEILLHNNLLLYLYTFNPNIGDIIKPIYFKKFESINIFSPVVPDYLLKYNNINILDVTEVIVNKIYTNFYCIGM